MEREKLSENFHRDEFSCRDLCGKADVNPRLIDLLQKVRDILGKPIKINSGVRCVDHNEKEGGSPTSAHLTGHAVDIACKYSLDRFPLIQALQSQFNRIGIARTFIHVDCDKSKDTNVIWLYKTKE